MASPQNSRSCRPSVRSSSFLIRNRARECCAGRPINSLPESCEVAVVGAGAAGLATAIFTRRFNPTRSVVLLDGARKPGAKILISGGSRCNVTNLVVSERDFWGGRSTIVRHVLRGFPVADTTAFFREIGVQLHEEADGKLFPDGNRARDVLDALISESARVGVVLLADHRVLDIALLGPGFRVTTSRGDLRAGVVVLATGGQSLPKSGSDGAGLRLASGLGHTIVPLTPGLVPLELADDEPLHRELSGVSQDVQLTLWINDAAATQLTAALLWTHFGVSGPVALNMSRHWLRAQVERVAARLTVNFCSGGPFEAIDRQWTAYAADRPKASVRSALASTTPASFADVLLRSLAIDGTQMLPHFSREGRRRLVHALTAWPLPVTSTRGYTYAEVTAGGVALSEIDPSTMESRIVPGVYLVGEILDVDGRIGGFNFQWAWSTAHAAGKALAGA
jgi:predicted Rossmann fold flavoprotein